MASDRGPSSTDGPKQFCTRTTQEQWRSSQIENFELMLESTSSQLEGKGGQTEAVKKVIFVETSYEVHSMLHIIIVPSDALNCDHN